MHARVGLPCVLPRHPVRQRGEDVEWVPAGGQSDCQYGVCDGGGEAGGEDSGQGGREEVQEDSTEHTGEEKGRVVMVDVQNSSHGPEWDVVKAPTKEQPGWGHQCLLPLLHHGWALRHPSLGLEAGPGVDYQEDEEEHDVPPPDDRVPQQVHARFVVSG